MVTVQVIARICFIFFFFFFFLSFFFFFSLSIWGMVDCGRESDFILVFYLASSIVAVTVVASLDW